MNRPTDWRWLAAVPLPAVGQTQTAALEGDLANHAALALVSLGIIAIVVGVRNLREIGDKRIGRAADNATPRSTEIESRLR